MQNKLVDMPIKTTIKFHKIITKRAFMELEQLLEPTKWAVESESFELYEMISEAAITDPGLLDAGSSTLAGMINEILLAREAAFSVLEGLPFLWRQCGSDYEKKALFDQQTQFLKRYVDDCQKQKTPLFEALSEHFAIKTE